MFKDKLKQLRTEKGYTQSDVANAIGVTAATIGNYEQGSRQPRGDEAWQKLADFLEVSVDELMDKKKTIRWADVKDDPKYKNMKITIKQPKYTVPKDLKNNLREECRIIYKKIDITHFFRSSETTISSTKEQFRAYIEFSERASHALLARCYLFEILSDIEDALCEEILENLQQYINRIMKTVVFWYTQCWSNLDGVFDDKVTDLPSLNKLIFRCFLVDDVAVKEFYLKKIEYDFSWLNEKLR